MTLPGRHGLVGLVLALTVVFAAAFAGGPADEDVSTTHEGHDEHDSSDDGLFQPGPGPGLVLVVVGLVAVGLRRRG